MPLLWTKEHERNRQRLYLKHKGTSLEQYVNKLGLSIHTLYEVNESTFWSVVKEKGIRDLRIKQKRNRIRRYIRGMFDTFSDNIMLSSHIYLVTLTFDDKSLALLSATTRKRYVKAFLSSVNLDYFACIDFGKKSGREHYHAICAISDECIHYVLNEKVNKSFLQYVEPWSYGFHTLKRITTEHKSLVKTCAYAFKASAYAFKNADSEHTPFHARNVSHQRAVLDDFDLRLFERTLNKYSPVNCSSGFEVARSSYEPPYVWFVDALTSLSLLERA